MTWMTSRVPLLAPRSLLRGVVLSGALALAGCLGGPAALTTYDLSAPRARLGGSIPGQVVVATPAAIQLYQSDRIVVRDAAGAVSLLPQAQLADQLPALIQARMIETFENATRTRSVSRPGDRINPDYQLATDLRAFRIDAASGEAVIEISARLVQDRTGQVVAARVFSARRPVGAIEAAGAVRALDEALDVILVDMARWLAAGRAAARA